MQEKKEQADAGDASAVGGPRIGIAIGVGQNGKLVLKWALEKVIPPEAVVCFLHVQTPLRSLPNGTGGYHPIEKLSDPETVHDYREELVLEVERILGDCRMLCDRRKVKSEVYYIESNSVQKGIVDQVYKLGITTLLLGKSSESSLSRALRKDIPTSVVKHSPKFCKVLVVCKGKLHYVKDATQFPTLPYSTRSSNSEANDVRSSGVSETSASSAETTQDESKTTRGIQGEGRHTWSTVRDDQSSTRSLSFGHSQGSSPVGSTRSFSFGNSQGSSPVALSQGESKVENQSPVSLRSMPRNRLTAFEANLLESEATLFHQAWSLADCNDAQFTPRFGNPASKAGNAHSVEESFPGVNSKGCESTIPSVPPGDIGTTVYSEPSNETMYMITDDSEIILYPSHNVFSRMSSDLETSTSLSVIEGFSPPQKPLHVHTSDVMGPSMTFAKIEGLLVSEFDRLLNEAKQSAGFAEREARRQADNLKKTEEVIASAKTMLAEHERHRDDALEEAKIARRDQAVLQKRVVEEVRRHQETQAELEALKKTVSDYAVEADLAQQEAEAERKRCKETLLKLEEVTKKLEVERQLRKEAEEKRSLESDAKLGAMIALQREQQQFSEYSFQELQAATNYFSEENKLGEGGYGSVYKGKLYHTTVAVKVLSTEGTQGCNEFQKEVDVLSRIHHPHMVMLLGACLEKSCIVYEYMENGSLEDRLNCKDGTPPLPWYIRFRICLEIATALLFLHSMPVPIVHRDLKPGNVLLNHCFVSKISDVGLAKLVPNNVSMYQESMLVGTFAYIDPDYQRTGVVSHESDVYSLGIVMLQLLTGRPAIGVADLVEEAVDNGQLESVLDKSAGEWPLSEAMALACLSMQCAEPRRRHRPNLETKILPDLERIQNVAGVAAANMASMVLSSFVTRPIIPSFFFCPISKKIMQNPHMAADGFTYEHDAIKAWLQGHDLSPMTNLLLNHKNLIPNHILRSTIREWYDNNLI